MDASGMTGQDARGVYGFVVDDIESEEDNEKKYLDAARKRPRKRAMNSSTDQGGDDVPTFHTVSGERVVRVLCNGKDGLFRVDKRTIDCSCEVCSEIKKIMGLEELDMSPREFEYHAGMSHCKRWRSTIFLYNPAFKGSRGKTLGHWLDLHGNDAISFTAKVRGVHDYLLRTYAVPAGRGWGCKHAEQNWEGLVLEKELHDRRQMRVEKNGGKVSVNVPMHGYAHTPDYPKSHAHPGHLYTLHGLDASEDVDEPPAPASGRPKRKPGRPVNPELLAEKRQAVAEAVGSTLKPFITSFEVLEDTMGLSVKISYGRAVYSGVLDLARVRKTKGSADPVAALKAESMGGDIASPTTGTAPTSGTTTPRDASTSLMPEFGVCIPVANNNGHPADGPVDMVPSAPRDSSEFGAERGNVTVAQPIVPLAPQTTTPGTHQEALGPPVNLLAPEPPTIAPEQQPIRTTYVPPGPAPARRKQWGKTPEQKEAEFKRMSAEGPQPSDTCDFCGTHSIDPRHLAQCFVCPARISPTTHLARLAPSVRTAG
jgi:hypothetical protein